MNRREFIRLLGGSTAAWPFAARAQRSSAMRRIAVVGGLAPDDVETVARSAAFEQALAALGWTKGRTIEIDYRWIGNDLALDAGVGTCGKDGQSVPVGVGQPTLRIDGLTVGGTA